jgi:hypothetical protein
MNCLELFCLCLVHWMHFQVGGRAKVLVAFWVWRWLYFWRHFLIFPFPVLPFPLILLIEIYGHSYTTQLSPPCLTIPWPRLASTSSSEAIILSVAKFSLRLLPNHSWVSIPNRMVDVSTSALFIDSLRLAVHTPFRYSSSIPLSSLFLSGEYCYSWVLCIISKASS